VCLLPALKFLPAAMAENQQLLADQVFYEVLTKVPTHYSGRRAPVLVDRAAPSITLQLAAALRK
jgi:hypothetical protein